MSREETRLRVVDALDEIMQTTPIERVKVVDLCAAAHVARTTFYENFVDVFAVTTWLWDHLMEGTLYQAGVSMSYYEAHLRAFEAMRGRQTFLARASRSVGYESICQHGGRSMGEHLERVYTERVGRGLTTDEALQMDFYSAGAKHATRRWMERGMPEEPEQMARTFERFVPRFLLPYLEPPVAGLTAAGAPSSTR